MSAYLLISPSISTGIGLYLTAAMANHSCQPNAAQTFEGTRLALRALSPIRAGEEVCAPIRYCAIMVSLAFEPRRRRRGRHLLYTFTKSLFLLPHSMTRKPYRLYWYRYVGKNAVSFS
jgi:hypothetical protein